MSSTDRQERALIALYEARAFSYYSRKSVRLLVERGYLTDSRYAGPLAALGDRRLVASRHELVKNHWRATDWWLTDEGRAAALGAFASPRVKPLVARTDRYA
jgi:hypothetical protein